MYDEFLKTYFGDYLSKYLARCSNRDKATLHDIFYDLYDDDLWNILLTREYSNYAAIKAVLPGLPPHDLQRTWNGICGIELSLHSSEFYKKVKSIFYRINGKPLGSAKILDFGCGWGRLIRYFAKDVPEGSLCGCDPDERILNVCLDTKVPGILRRSEYRPRGLPFEEKFDLIYAYSVFTHLSERTHWECLQAVHDALAPDGIVILTVRPRSFIEIKGTGLSQVSDEAADVMARQFDKGQFVFFPYNLSPINGEITYGEAAIPYAYIKQHWTKMFHLIGALVFQADPYQMPIVLKKR